MKTLVLTVFCSAAMILCGVAQATTIYVPDGYSTIQGAIDAASNGDTVIVRAGTYTGSGNRDIQFHGKAIVLEAEDGPDATIINCEGTETNAHRGFDFHGGETAASVLAGFKIMNGFANGDGGAIIIWSDSNPTIIDCEITNSTAFYSSSVEKSGGGIFIEYSSPTISNCVLWSNSAMRDGGAIECYASDATIISCVLWSNSAVERGGAIACHENSSPTIAGCWIKENESGQGGGIYIIDSHPTLETCVIWSNSSTQDGGGICCGYYADSGDVNLTRCTISHNKAGGYGGGIGCFDTANGAGSDAMVADCLIVGNEAARGGGVYCTWHSESIIGNSTISENTAEEEDGGGGIECAADMDAEVINSILWNNSPSEIEAPGTQITVTYSDVEVEDGWPGTGNIEFDPLFVQGPFHDYYLSQEAAGQEDDSPCVDAGSDNADNLGMDKLTTRTDGPRDAGTVDMGYHAVYPKLEITDVLWSQSSASVVITFTSVEDAGYIVQTADADRYSSVLLWTTSQEVSGDDGYTTVTDSLSTNPLTEQFRFYRIKRTDLWGYSTQTAGVFEMTVSPSVSVGLYYISTPLVPDTDHDSVPQIFGENVGGTDGRQIPRANFTVSDLNETTGQINRMRNASGTYSVISGTSFDIEAGRAYEIELGSGPPGNYPLRFTGYVSETDLSVDLTKTGTQALSWFAYGMPRTVKLSSLGLPTLIAPWAATNRVQILWHGASAYTNYTYSDGVWSPSDPDLVPGTGMILQNNGPPGAHSLTEATWYLHPPNDY